MQLCVYTVREGDYYTTKVTFNGNDTWTLEKKFSSARQAQKHAEKWERKWRKRLE